MNTKTRFLVFTMIIALAAIAFFAFLQTASSPEMTSSEPEMISSEQESTAERSPANGKQSAERQSPATESRSAKRSPPATAERSAERRSSSGELSLPPMASASPRAASPVLLVDQILDSMELGNIAFNAPSAMNVAQSAQIHLLISLEQSIEELQSEITAEGEREGASIRVSPRMEARLSGSGFQITAITPEEQAITSRGRTEWRWEVKPKGAGQHNLHLTLTALFTVDGQSTRRAIRTFDKTIAVEVTIGQRMSGFVSENWQWLWAAILVPIAGWLWRTRKNHTAHP